MHTQASLRLLLIPKQLQDRRSRCQITPQTLRKLPRRTSTDKWTRAADLQQFKVKTRIQIQPVTHSVQIGIHVYVYFISVYCCVIKNKSTHGGFQGKVHTHTHTHTIQGIDFGTPLLIFFILNIWFSFRERKVLHHRIFLSLLKFGS